MSILKAEILSTETPELFEAAVGRAADLLRAGEVVALPTETVYGLAANALQAQSVEKIFEIKNRPAVNPVIVHVNGTKMARQYVQDWPAEAEQLAQAFWPGPLTLVLNRGPEIPDQVTAGGKTVGIRWPSHPFFQEVIGRCGFPLAAPSANRSGQLSSTNAQHVRKSLGNAISLIVDGGQCQIGIESTVVDLTVHPARLLRPGMIHIESLLAVLGNLTLGFGDSEEILRSPGLLRKHYAPKAKLVVKAWQDDADLQSQLAKEKVNPKNIHLVTHTRIPSGANWGSVNVIPHDPEAFARALYAELHRCDEAGAELIVVEQLPENRAWDALRDRLNRAAA